MKFKKEDLQNLLWDDLEDEEGKWEIVEDEIIDNSRWSILHRMVFKYDGRFYETNYSRGATEMQDEQPFEHEDDEIECYEVWPHETIVIEYTRTQYK